MTVKDLIALNLFELKNAGVIRIWNVKLPGLSAATF